MHKIRLAGPLTFDSVVDGPGLRTVIWMQGCNHHCLGCHNMQTHSIDGGYVTDIHEIIDQYRRNPIQQGITISGGEPFLQSDALLTLLRAIHPFTKSIWLYTGYTFEELIDNRNPNFEQHLRILCYLNVLVDGRFDIAKKDSRLLYCGSTNQRLIDIARTSWTNTISIWDTDNII